MDGHVSIPPTIPKTSSTASSKMALLKEMIKKEAGEITGIAFGILSAQEILAHSVGEVTSVNVDPDNPEPNSLYDRVQGSTLFTPCDTCGQEKNCPGHPAHITLEIPVFNPLFFKEILQLCRISCPHCYRCLISKERAACLGIKSKGLQRLQTFVNMVGKDKQCPHCFKGLPKYQEKNEYVIEYCYEIDVPKKEEDKKEEESDKPKWLKLEPRALHTRFCKIPMDDYNNTGMNDFLPENPVFYDPSIQVRAKTKHRFASRPEDLIITVFPVIPMVNRPPDFEGKRDDITGKYHETIKANNDLRAHRLGDKNLSPSDKLKKEAEVTYSVTTIIDNSKAKAANQTKENDVRTLKGRVQGDVAKDSIFRAYIQGRRVDYSSRSVIGPGAHLDVDQLGVPNVISDTLTRPYVVNESNLEWCQKMLDEGQVNIVERKGFPHIIRFGNRPPKKFQLIPRSAKYPGDKIALRLRNNDPVLFNRQPTLLEESMMGFRLHREEGNTFRLPLAVCTAFNSDKVVSNNLC